VALGVNKKGMPQFQDFLMFFFGHPHHLLLMLWTAPQQASRCVKGRRLFRNRE